MSTSTELQSAANQENLCDQGKNAKFDQSAATGQLVIYTQPGEPENTHEPIERAKTTRPIQAGTQAETAKYAQDDKPATKLRSSQPVRPTRIYEFSEDEEPVEE
ncbi:unnamed protein product [Fusarium graminearum]|nr:unnamed protein product [Fusarium graminearum]